MCKSTRFCLNPPLLAVGCCWPPPQAPLCPRRHRRERPATAGVCPRRARRRRSAHRRRARARARPRRVARQPGASVRGIHERERQHRRPDDGTRLPGQIHRSGLCFFLVLFWCLLFCATGISRSPFPPTPAFGAVVGRPLVIFRCSER